MKLSIVTPTYNMAHYLPETIRSVLEQAGDFELEYLVVDGASTDETLDVLEAVQDSRFRYISEPDEGQSDAINKGLAQLNGDVVAWLNADDIYEPGSLAAVAKAFADSPDAAWLTGVCEIVDANNQPIRESVKRYKNKRLCGYSYSRLLNENFISQPATFWRNEAMRQAGLLDRSLNWAMDYDLWLRLGKLSGPIVLDRTLARFRLYAESKTGRFERAQYDEDYNVAMRYMSAGRSQRLWRRLHTEKIVLAYRLLKLIGR